MADGRHGDRGVILNLTEPKTTDSAQQNVFVLSCDNVNIFEGGGGWVVHLALGHVLVEEGGQGTQLGHAQGARRQMP